MKTVKVKNLSSILFYSGDERENVALATEGRIFGASYDGYGELIEESNKQINWKKYSTLNFEETKPQYEVLGDLFDVVAAYTHKVDTTTGDIEVIDSKYSANYTYESDLSNKFGNATSIIQSDLKKFLINCNLNNYNKRKYYTYDNTYNGVEVRSIQYNKVDYKWYPEGTVAYSQPYAEDMEGCFVYTYTKVEELDETATENIYSYTSVFQDNINSKRPSKITYLTNSEVIQLEPTEEVPEPEVVLATKTTTYTYAYTYNFTYEWADPYIIGGNYYSYVMKTYAVFDDMLATAVSTELEKFAEKYNHDESIYAYYMYDCKPTVEFTFNTYSLGLKKTGLNFTFDSDYNEWYTYSIDLHAKLDADDNICTLGTIAGQIYNIKLNEKTNLTGENRLAESNSTMEFKANIPTTEEDSITILTPNKITSLKLDNTKFVGELDLTKNKWNKSKGDELESINISNTGITKLIGINEFSKLKTLNIANCASLVTPYIDKLPVLDEFIANNTTIDSFIPKDNIKLTTVKLPETIKTIKLVNNEITSFEYTPNDILSSLTLKNVKGIDTFDIVTKWYESLKDADKLDSVIYLDLEGFNWKDVDSQFALDINKFDICNLIGDMHLIGTGEDNKLTRKEYRNILNSYGEDAFELSLNNNVLQLYSPGFETYEFDINISNTNTLIDETGLIIDRVEETSEGVFENIYYQTDWGQQIEVKGKLAVHIENNRAGNSFLDDIEENPNRVYTIDRINKYVYFVLDNPYDTDDTIQVDNKVQYVNISKGDIMLFNGNQICIFYENVTNYNYNYIKIGHFDDITFEDDDLNPYSSIEEILVLRHTEDDANSVNLTFHPAVKEVEETTPEDTETEESL